MFHLLAARITWQSCPEVSATRLCTDLPSCLSFIQVPPTSPKMMFKKFAAVASLAVLAVATPTPQSSGQCSTGPIQCCQSVQSSSSGGLVSVLLGLLGVVLDGVNVPIGVTCSPISVIGVGGTSCSAQPVCCENNNFNGVIAVGCSPINIGL